MIFACQLQRKQRGKHGGSDCFKVMVFIVQIDRNSDMFLSLFFHQGFRVETSARRNGKAMSIYLDSNQAYLQNPCIQLSSCYAWADSVLCTGLSSSDQGDLMARSVIRGDHLHCALTYIFRPACLALHLFGGQDLAQIFTLYVKLNTAGWLNPLHQYFHN